MAGMDWGAVIDSADTQQSTPTPKAGIPALTPAPASPPASDDLWGAVIDQANAANLSAAQGADFRAQNVNPDQAAQGMALSAQTGIPHTVATDNLTAVQQQAQLQQNAAIFRQNPLLA